MNVKLFMAIGFIIFIMDFFPVATRADIVTPYSTGLVKTTSLSSWESAWNIYNSTATPVSQIEQFIIPIGTTPNLLAPGADAFYPFGSPTWKATIVNPAYLMLAGPQIYHTDQLIWEEHYTGAYSTQQFYVDSFAYQSPNTLVDSSRWEWTGTSWVVDASVTLNPTDPIYDRASSSVPEPSILMLLVSGMACLGVWGRKKFKRL